MAIAVLSPTFLIAAVCVALMGYAIQRGGTCMVAAIDEVVSHRKATRILALGEAALWVTTGLFIAHALGGLPRAPSGFGLMLTAVAGGAALGLGALLNRACVFGTIARFGSGEWAYAFTPLGFFVGCLTAAPLVAATMPSRVQPSALFALPVWILGAVAPLVIWRAYEVVAAARDGKFTQRIWSPHLATAVIGVTFVATMLTVGAWTYTDLLAEWAKGAMARDVWSRSLLFVALLLGAMAGGWTSRRIRLVLPPVSSLARCFAGGWLMGLGSLLIPGGNDGLLLVGLPLIQPHAWAAIASMAFIITAGLMVQRRYPI
jgi:toxin CptA